MLNPAETRKAQIEKLLWSGYVEIFYFPQYLWELQTIRLVTDHKHLVPLIIDKDLDQVPY